MSTLTYRTERSRAGFTLAEMIVAVMVMVAAVALVVPNVLSVQRDMRVTELNDDAQALFSEAQYRVTALQNSGQLDALEIATRAADDVVLDDGTTLRVLLSTYATDSHKDDVMGQLVSQVNERGQLTGDFAIEVAPSLGKVYAVYYWEDDATGYTSNASLFYSSVRNRGADNLESLLVGYYQGGLDGISAVSTVDAAAGMDDPISPGVHVVNGEDLYICIVDDEFTSFDPNKFELTVGLRQGEQAWTNTYPGGELGITHGDDEVDIILDSLYGDAVISDFGMEPGQPMDVTVTWKYGEGQESTQTFNVNSSFDSSSTDTEAHISTLRHLLNLSKLPAGSGVTTAVLDNDITFDRSTWGTITQDGATLRTFALHRSANIAIAPIELQKPITFDGAGKKVQKAEFNSALSGAVAQQGLFATVPAGTTIKDLTVEDAAIQGNAGGSGVLVGSITGGDEAATARIQNVTVRGTVGATSDAGGLVGAIEASAAIENCTAEVAVTANDSNAGGLVGSINSQGQGGRTVTVTGCTVAGEGASVQTQGNAGGLVGAAGPGATVETCAVGADDAPVSVLATGGNAGGLAGLAQGATLRGSTANATVQMSGSNAGGFVGESVDSTVSGNTARGTVAARGNVAGGFAGHVSGGALSGNLSQVDVTEGQSSIGGFVGYAEGGQIDACEAQGDVTAEGGYVGGFAGVASGGMRISHSSATSDFTAANPRAHTVRAQGPYLGGFVGDAFSADFSDCFSAVNVAGPTRVSIDGDGMPSSFAVGGFAGMARVSASFQHCYASGNVTGYRAVGGFAGIAISDTGAFNDNYACGTITAVNDGNDDVMAAAGGFIGQIDAGTTSHTWANNYAYGRVTACDADGGYLPLSAGDEAFGGFVGGLVVVDMAYVDTVGGSNNYLVAQGYNDALHVYEGVAPAGAGRGELAANNSSTYSHPFGDLSGAFPFRMVTGHLGGEANEHYGDWPTV